MHVIYQFSSTKHLGLAVSLCQHALLLSKLKVVMKNYVDKHKIVCRLQKSYLQTNEFLKLTNALPFQKLFDIRALHSGSSVFIQKVRRQLARKY